MRKNLFVALVISSLLILPIILSGCSKPFGGGSDSDDRLKAVATIFPIYDILREVGGDKVEAVLIIPPGSSPHTFSLSPSTTKKLQKTDLFLAVGGELDNWAPSFNAAIGSREYLELADFIDLRPFGFEHSHDDQDGQDDEEGEDEDDHADDLDPHYWLDPLNASIIAEQIALALGRLDSENEAYYLARAEDFSVRINSRMEGWLARMSELENREMIVFHDAWGYFADRFDLEIVAAFEPFPGKSPSPKYLENLQAEIIRHDIKALFIEPQLSVSAAQSLAQDLNINIATLDPIGGYSGRENYFDLIDYNLETIFTALSTE